LSQNCEFVGILGADFGTKNGNQKGVQKWTPNLAPQKESFISLKWGVNLGANIGTKSGTKK